MKKTEQGAEKPRADTQELEFLESIARRLPEDTEVLRALADLYTRTGDYTEGLRIDERLSHLCAEEPLVWYNLGCSLALMERIEDALEALSRAVELGYDDYEWMKKDSDLTTLHGEPRFESMLDWIYNTFVQLPE
ncbi:MAG: tetratricopeptide repeat protein [Kiritimatiellales bacterium]|nr:tetratricopeptide repeat protein [Kiritimatiellota bacterium]MBL7012650.1 tetratricopeptide repeat protein [Kiritimatiellales bacterium]